MPLGSPRPKDVDKLLAALDPPQRDIARALRRLVLRAGPELQESIMYGVPVYRGKSYVCAIAAHSDHTNLQFYRGTSLRDTARLLEGTGKNLRHVKLYTLRDVRRPDLEALLHEAIELDTS